MSLLAFLVSIPLGDILSKIPHGKLDDPPRAYAESTRLPGKAPANGAELLGSWQLQYSLDDAQIDDFNGEVVVHMVVQFEAEGRYRLQYSARWGNPPGKSIDAGGVTVDEMGSYKVSSDMLILDPEEVTRTDYEKTKPAGSVGLANEKHLLVVQRDAKRLHLAGRCAPYQVDPICKNWQVENAWFTFKGPSRKVLGD